MDELRMKAQNKIESYISLQNTSSLATPIQVKNYKNFALEDNNNYNSNNNSLNNLKNPIGENRHKQWKLNIDQNN